MDSAQRRFALGLSLAWLPWIPTLIGLAGTLRATWQGNRNCSCAGLDFRDVGHVGFCIDDCLSSCGDGLAVAVFFTRTLGAERLFCGLDLRKRADDGAGWFVSLADIFSSAAFMKQATRNRTSRAGKPTTIDEYLARVPEPARTTLNKMRAVIRSVVPEGTTEEISYRIPTFRYKKMLVALAAFKDHCSFFPLGSSALAGLEDELSAFRVSKGTLHFPVDKPMPAALVKKIVRARIAQNERK